MRYRRSLGRAALAACITAVVAATALAAAPKKGATFKGTEASTSGPLTLGKYSAQLRFKVSSTGTHILGLKYQSLGCFGAGGFGNKNPYSFPGVTKTFGPIAVLANGTFSAPATRSTYKAASTIVTTSSLAGKFTSPKKASGTITFSQKLTYKGKSQTCGPVTLTFSAAAH